MLLENKNNTEKQDYKKKIIEAGIFFSGFSKGSFILPPNGFVLWENIKKNLDKLFLREGIQNVLLPTFVPLELFEKEKKHVEGFNPELFFVKKKIRTEVEENLVLRPTSEVLFCQWYKKIVNSYQQLPLLYNQWCSVFRAEKNTNTFLRSTEFYWQEGHSIHNSEEQAWSFFLTIVSLYKNYIKKFFRIMVVVGEKSQKEKFFGALKSYTIECFLPEGLCLQLATVHFFGNVFCKIFGVKFLNQKDQFQNPFSVSWGMSTRTIGALTKMHQDDLGVFFPFFISPVQIAFVLIRKNKEIEEYYLKVRKVLNRYRFKIYEQYSQFNYNLFQADKEGCPIKIVLGAEEVKTQTLTLIKRCDINKKRIVIFKEKKEVLKIIKEEIFSYQNILFERSKNVFENIIVSVSTFNELLKQKNDNKNKVFFFSFCDLLECEIKIREKFVGYSIRCLKEITKLVHCLFCKTKTKFKAYLGRSF